MAKKTTTTKVTVKGNKPKPVTKKADPPSDPPDDPMPQAEEKKPWRVQCKAGLLTYNNPEIGVMDPDKFLEEMRAELKEKFPNTEFSLCVEKESRLHLHVFFECDEKFDCDLNYFETSKSGKCDDCKNNRGKNLAQGHYYCQCVWKDSHIACLFDVYKNVCGDWLMNLWKAKPCKLTEIEKALATEKLLKPQYQQQIQACKNYREKEKVEKMMAERSARIKAKMKKFAVNPQVQRWLEEYEQEEMRYNFLVLCGPSKMRKTEFAKSLFKNPFVHKDKVDWDGYCYSDHDAIIFDDVRHPKMVWAFVHDNKVLFQASGIVSVNNSATNCFKRDICVAGKPIIICTNDGLLDPFVNAPFRQWIETNSVWVDVDDPIPYFEEYNVAIEDVRVP